MIVEKAADAPAERGVELALPVQARAFDALFHRALGGERVLLQLLTTCGYDPEAPAPAYTAEVWTDCVEVARRHLFGAVSPDEGHRALGRLFADGFANTVVGQVYRGVGYTGRAYMARIPEMMRLARRDLDVEVTFESDQRCRIMVRGPFSNGPFMAGLLEARVHQRGLLAKVEVARQDEDGYDLIATW